MEKTNEGKAQQLSKGRYEFKDSAKRFVVARTIAITKVVLPEVL